MSFNYSVEIRNVDDDLVAVVEQDLSELSWRYDSIGGCGDSTAALRWAFDEAGDVDLDYDVQVWRLQDPFGSPGARLPAELPFQLGEAFAASRELRWSGFIRELTPVLDEVEKVTLALSGYVRQLQYIAVPAASYTNQDVAQIVASIIDTYVTPVSKIQHTAALNLIQNTAVIGANLAFDSSAFEAISTLAEIGGNAEWGVRADREFYFMPRSTAVKQSYEIGDRIKFYQASRSTDEIVTKVFLRGGNGLTATLTNPLYSGTLQKQRVVLVPSILSAADAIVWGQAYFAKHGTAQPKGTLKLGAVDLWIEQIEEQVMPPLGRLRVHGAPESIGVGPSGSQFGASGIQIPFQLSGVSYGTTNESFRVESIIYRPTANDLEIEIQLGEKRGSLADMFRSIEFRLSELRQGVTA